MGNKKFESPKLFTIIYNLMHKIPFLQKLRMIYFYIDFFILLTLKKPKKENENPKKKVLVVFNAALGDCVMYLGLLDSYRRIYNKDEYEITIICQNANAILFEDKFDKIIKVKFTKFSVSISERKRVFKIVRENYYNIVIDPIGSFVFGPNVFVTRAAIADKKISIWHKNKSNQCPMRIVNNLYDELFDIDPNGMHRIEWHAEFLRRLGDDNCIAHPAFIPDKEMNIELPEKFFIVYPSASIEVKCWPEERYAEIVNKIYQKTKLPLVVCGTEHDIKHVQEMRKYIDKDVKIVDIIGKTDIRDFIECIGRAEFVITNDTSTYHIAIAKKVKTFILAGGYTFDSFVNYNFSELGYKDPIIINHKMDCYNCGTCIYKVEKCYQCIEKITTEYAWNIIEKNI